MIQSHLKKLFAGVHSVEFDSQGGEDNNRKSKLILAMKSLDGERVKLSEPVNVTTNVEVCFMETFDKIHPSFDITAKYVSLI